MGASVIKVEPPGGDPLALMCPGYYRDLSAGQEVARLDLKDQKDRASLDDMDLLLTASRPAALGRLGLSWPELHADFLRLCQVAIVGHPHPNEDAPGHDLTHQARFGTLSPPGMPSVLVAEPLRQGLTAPGGVLGNGFPGYGLYRGRESHVALGALEPHSWERLSQELGVEGERQDLGSISETEQWEEWAADRDLPLATVRDVEQNEVEASASQRRRTSTRGEDE
jgi:crotonobetainyl-CoA:carnitine CoA-transferase CaiB-like acyl-CoA transferase